MGANARHLEALYSVQKIWTDRGATLTDTIRLRTQVKDLIEIRDSYVAEHLSYSDCKIMIDYSLCVFLNIGIVYMFGFLKGE